MKSKIKQANLLNGKSLSLLRNILIVLTIAWAIILSASVLAAVCSVQDINQLDAATASLGDLDLTFGGDGTVITDLGNNLDDSAYAVAVQPDGKVLAVGYVSTSSTGRDFAVIRLDQNCNLDTTFSDDGRLSFNFNSATRDDIARAVAVQPDGKIVIAGEADVLGFGNVDIVLARLNSDGTFDTSFGSNGKVVTNLPNDRADYGRALVLQPDGRILVAGYSNRAATGDDFVVIRYNSNGSLDTSFNGLGIVTTDILASRADAASSLTLQTDGRIVVAGYTNDPSFRNNFAVVRYNTDGSLDSSFNGTGKVSTDLNLNSDDVANAVTLQSDGRIVVAGQSAADFGLARYNSNGSLDSSFGGGDGIVTTNFGTGAIDIGRAVVVQSDGKITVAGRSQSELAFARYGPDGTPDNSFDLDGRLVQNAGNNYISAYGGYWGMALQADGRIVAAGDGWRDGFRNDFAVSRLNANGTFDLSFDMGDGIAATDMRSRADDATSVAIQSDGKIVVAGAAQNATGGSDFAVTRYNTNGTLDTSFDGDGIVITDIQGHPDDAGFAVAIQADGKIVVAGKTDNASDGNLDDGVLIRYNSNGTLDSTFGNNGITITTGGTIISPDTGATWLYMNDLKIQADGKIVAAGQAHYFSISADGFVARYNGSGALESKTLINFSTEDTINAVALQADGKIVVAGSVGSGPGSDFALARLNPNLSLDTSFDIDGKVITNFANSHLDAAYDLAIQADGKILAVGETIASGTGSDMAIARYNLNGSLDTTFGGSDGTAHIDFFNYRDYASAVAIQPDGKIILAGLADAQIDTGFGVVKLNPNGTFDTNFGGGSGRVRTLFGDAVGSALSPAPNDMALQSDGKIVFVGSVNYNSTSRDFIVVRYENNYLNCSYTINPAGLSFSYSGGSSNFSINATAAACPWAAQSNASWITTNSSGTGSGTVIFTVAANASAARTGTISVGGQTFTVMQDAAPPPSTIQLSQPGYTVAEGAGFLNITVTRSGAIVTPATIKYATSDSTDANFKCDPNTPGQTTGIASRKCDYHIAVGTLRFAAGEASKQVALSVVDDVYAEGPETFTLTLSNSVGATLGQNNSVSVTITDDDAPGKPNPIDQTRFFVRQLYVDLLSREPDPAGWNGWTSRIDQCGQPGQPPPPCDRVTVGGDGFLRSGEFFDRQFFVIRLYRTGLGRILRYDDVGDLAHVSGFLTAEQLELNKQDLVVEIMSRQEFRNRYDAITDPLSYVAALEQTAGVTVSNEGQLIRDLANGVKTRAQVFREISESSEVSNKYLHEAQVVSAYYGFFTRNPDGAYLNYLQRLDSGEINLGDLANAFINAVEYRSRFGK